MEPMSSPSLCAAFERLHAQRGNFFPMIERMGMETLWHRLSNADWAVGDTILHLCKTMRIYRRLTRLSLPGLFPVDWLLLNRPFDRNAVDLFAEYQAAGKRTKASLPLVPHRPSRLASLHELQDQLEPETCRMKNMLARLTEGVAGHFRIFDPGVRSPNLIQRVQLLAFHERHHFKAMGHLIADQGLGFQKKVVRRNGPQASLD